MKGLTGDWRGFFFERNEVSEILWLPLEETARYQHACHLQTASLFLAKLIFDFCLNGCKALTIESMIAAKKEFPSQPFLSIDEYAKMAMKSIERGEDRRQVILQSLVELTGIFGNPVEGPYREMEEPEIAIGDTVKHSYNHEWQGIVTRTALSFDNPIRVHVRMENGLNFIEELSKIMMVQKNERYRTRNYRTSEDEEEGLKREEIKLGRYVQCLLNEEWRGKIIAIVERPEKPTRIQIELASDPRIQASIQERASFFRKMTENERNLYYPVL